MFFQSQIKNRLYSIKEKFIFFLLLSQSIIYSNASYAQSSTSSGPFSPTEGDLSVKMLAKLFGGLVGGGGADPLKDLISTFNSVILAVGGILVAYTIFAGTIGTAHEGKMLGKFSSVWVPLRTSIGAALVVPINGYCVMQMLVMWLILQGIGLADSVWTAAVNGNAIMNGTITAYPDAPGIKDLAQNTLKAATCVVAAKKNNEDVLGITSEKWGYYDKTLNKKNYIYFGAQNTIGSQDTCGKVALIDETTESTGNGNFGDFANVNKEMFGQGSTAAIIQIQNSAMRAMVASLYNNAQNLIVVQTEGDVKKVVSNVEAYSDSFINEAIDTYNKSIKEGMKSYFSNSNQTDNVKKMTNEGWIMAGAWFVKQANVMSQATVGLTTIPTATSGTLRKSYDYEDANNALKPIYNRIDSYSAVASKKGEIKKITIESDEEDKKGSKWYEKLSLASVTGEFLTGIDLRDIAEQVNVHPIIQMKQMGDRMVTTAVGAIGVIIGLTFAAGATQGSGVAAATVVAPIAFSIFGGLITLGFFLSYYIPMMPFFIWLGCLIGWFILVLEAIIAAPLWAIMHLHPNGDDVVGRGGQGYMLVLGLLIRPTLMIFGLISALILSGVLGQFINSLFYDVFIMSRLGADVGFFAILLGYVLYTTMMLSFVKKMFSVIHSIPDQLLQWIGGGGSQLGQYAGAITEGTAGEFTKAGAQLGRLGGEGLQAGLASAQRGLAKKQHNEEAKQREAHNAGLSVDDAPALAKKDGGGDSLGAMKKMSAARSELQAAGASATDLAQFNQEVKGSGEGTSLNEAIQDAKDSFMNEKFGPGASAAVNSAGNSIQGTDSNDGKERQKATDGKKAAQNFATSKLADAKNNMNPAAFKAFMGDVSTALSNGADSSNPNAYNNPAVASTLDSYQMSKGQFKDKTPAEENAVAVSAVFDAYMKQSSSLREENSSPAVEGSDKSEPE